MRKKMAIAAAVLCGVVLSGCSTNYENEVSDAVVVAKTSSSNRNCTVTVEKGDWGPYTFDTYCHRTDIVDVGVLVDVQYNNSGGALVSPIKPKEENNND